MVSPFRVWWYNFTLPVRNWWLGAFGRRKAFIEGRDLALDHAAMIAHDMGRPDIREAINNAVKRAG
jgi:hypothetical protein